ncbi:MAG: hypothetical protein SOV74_00450 [Coriobacteriales bacterium]|nr:hypothetical protein [Coriobacteriales bacterium]
MAHLMHSVGERDLPDPSRARFSFDPALYQGGFPWTDPLDSAARIGWLRPLSPVAADVQAPAENRPSWERAGATQAGAQGPAAPQPEGFLGSKAFYIARYAFGMVDVVGCCVDGKVYDEVGLIDLTQLDDVNPLLEFESSNELPADPEQGLEELGLTHLRKLALAQGTRLEGQPAGGAVTVRGILDVPARRGSWNRVGALLMYHPDAPSTAREGGSVLSSGALATPEEFVSWVFLHVGLDALWSCQRFESKRLGCFDLEHAPVYQPYLDANGGNLRIQADNRFRTNHPAIRYYEAMESAQAIFNRRHPGSTRQQHAKAVAAGAHTLPYMLQVFCHINAQAPMPIMSDEVPQAIRRYQMSYYACSHLNGPFHLSGALHLPIEVERMKQAAAGDLDAVADRIDILVGRIECPYRIEFSHLLNRRDKSGSVLIYLPQRGIFPVRHECFVDDDLPLRRISERQEAANYAEGVAAEALTVAACVFTAAPWLEKLTVSGVALEWGSQRTLFSGVFDHQELLDSDYGLPGRALEVCQQLTGDFACDEQGWPAGAKPLSLPQGEQVRFCGFAELDEHGWPRIQRMRLAQLYQSYPVGFPLSALEEDLLFNEPAPDPAQAFALDDVAQVLEEAESLVDSVSDFDLDALMDEIDAAAAGQDAQAVEDTAGPEPETAGTQLSFEDEKPVRPTATPTGTGLTTARPGGERVEQSTRWEALYDQMLTDWRTGRDKDAFIKVCQLTAPYEGPNARFRDTDTREYRSFGNLVERYLYVLGRCSDREIVYVRSHIAWAFFHKGIMLLQRHRLGEGEAALREAVRFNPEMAAAWIHLSLLYWRQRDFKMAMAMDTAAYHCAYRRPDLMMIFRGFGDLAFSKNQRSEASALYHIALGFSDSPDEVTLLDGNIEYINRLEHKKLGAPSARMLERLRTRGYPVGVDPRVLAVARVVAEDSTVTHSLGQERLALDVLAHAGGDEDAGHRLAML